jgi:hypothetical protein
MYWYMEKMINTDTVLENHDLKFLRGFECKIMPASVGRYIHAFIGSLPIPSNFINLLAHIHPDLTRRKNQYGFQNVVQEY